MTRSVGPRARRPVLRPVKNAACSVLALALALPLAGCAAGSPVAGGAATPVVTIAAGGTTVAAGNALTYEVNGVPAPDQALHIRVRVSGAGSGPESFIVAVTIEAGDTKATFNVPANLSRETTVTVELMPGSGYTVGRDHAVTIVVPATDGATTHAPPQPGPAPLAPPGPDPELPGEAPGASAGISFCARSSAVRRGILRAVPAATADCSGTGQTTVTAADLAAIHHLDLRRDRDGAALVQFRPGDLDGLTGVTVLNVTDNWLYRGLRASGAPCSFLRQLRSLWYGLNAIDRIRSADFFACLDNLEYLDLRGNNIRYEPGVHDLNPAAFCKIPKLRKLSIGSNRLRTLPARAFACLPDLEELDMFDMWYEFVHIGFGSDTVGPDVFAGLGRLKRLDLGFNALGAAPLDPALFDPLVNLEYLDLRDNPLLAVLPESAERLPAAVVIDMDPAMKFASEVARPENRPAAGQPRIVGAVQADRTLTVDLAQVQDPNGLPANFRYQWRHRGRMIEHAHHPTYTPDGYYAQDPISVTVTFTDLDGYPESVTSPAVTRTGSG